MRQHTSSALYRPEARRRPYRLLLRIEQRRSPFRLELRFRRAHWDEQKGHGLKNPAFHLITVGEIKSWRGHVGLTGRHARYQ